MLKKLIGLGMVFGVAAGVSVLAGGCTTTTTEVVSDSGTVKPTTDGSLPSGDSGATSGTCPNAIDASMIFDVLPPKTNTQGSCTSAEIATAAAGGATFASIYAAVSASCKACLFTESTDMTNNQFFLWADATHMGALLNFGACPGSALSGGDAACGKAVEHYQLCVDQACPTDDQGNAVCSDQTQCQSDAVATGGPCASYKTELSGACTQAVITACFDSQGSPEPGMALLCGGGGDGGDAGDAGDAGTD